MYSQPIPHNTASHCSFLAIDTAFDICSVALVTPQFSDARCSDKPRKHADDVLPMIETLLSAHRIGIASLDFLAIVSGPGSFTGLRIGTAVAQGLAFGADLPIVSVSSLAMMARCARLKTDADKILVTCMHAREAEFYFAAYRDEIIDAPEALIADTIFTPQQIKQSIDDLVLNSVTHTNASIVLAGPGWSHELLAELASDAEFQTISTELEATLLAQLAVQEFKAGKCHDAADAAPVYLKEDMEYRTV